MRHKKPGDLVAFLGQGVVEKVNQHGYVVAFHATSVPIAFGNVTNAEKLHAAVRDMRAIIKDFLVLTGHAANDVTSSWEDTDVFWLQAYQDDRDELRSRAQAVLQERKNDDQ